MTRYEQQLAQAEQARIAALQMTDFDEVARQWYANQAYVTEQQARDMTIEDAEQTVKER